MSHFFLESQVQIYFFFLKRWSKNKKRFLKKGEKRLINGERSMVKIGGNRKRWLVGEILKKKSWEKSKNVTCRGVFEQQN